ncbi:hypothetical protein KLP28_13260 [Nocardioidaceae bacterium]|nr:hypothetical protein KLP28_13260 [Nocardioidaceae bacterium]
MMLAPPRHAFRRGITASADLPGDCEAAYALLCDPGFVGRSAPFIRRITPLAEDLWRWEVGGISYPGGSFAAGFTQRMTFDAPHAISFHHDPAAAARGARGTRRAELAGAEGVFRVAPRPGDGVRVDLEMSVEAQVPAPRAAAPIVESAMGAVLVLMRDRFTAALQQELAP